MLMAIHKAMKLCCCKQWRCHPCTHSKGGKLGVMLQAAQPREQEPQLIAHDRLGLMYGVCPVLGDIA